MAHQQLIQTKQLTFWCLVLFAAYYPDAAEASLLTALRLGFYNTCYRMESYLPSKSPEKQLRQVFNEPALKPDRRDGELFVAYIIKDREQDLYLKIGKEFGMTGWWQFSPEYELALHQKMYTILKDTTPLDHLNKLKQEHPKATPVINAVIAEASASGRVFEWDWQVGGLDILSSGSTRGSFSDAGNQPTVTVSPLWASKHIPSPLEILEVIRHETTHRRIREKLEWYPGMKKEEFFAKNTERMRIDEYEATMSGISVYAELIKASAIKRSDISKPMAKLLEIFEDQAATREQKIAATYEVIDANYYEAHQRNLLATYFANPRRYFGP